MLEILALWQLTKRIGSIVEQKGHRSGWYKVLTVVLWFGGEIIGAIFGVLLTGASQSAQCLVYLFALGGAIAGAGVAYLIAISLSPASSATPLVSPGTSSTSLGIPSDSRRIGTVATIIGILFLCLLCPLLVNSLIFIASSTGKSAPISIYGQLFPTRVGMITAASYVSGAQYILSAIIALIVLTAGIAILVRTRRTSMEPKQ